MIARRSYMLLGTIARDHEVFESVLRRVLATPRVSHAVRRRTVLAASLLGVSSTRKAAFRLALAAGLDREGESDVRAAFLSLALADPTGVVASLTNLGQQLTGIHAERAHRAVRRAAKGLVLSVKAHMGSVR